MTFDTPESGPETEFIDPRSLSICVPNSVPLLYSPCYPYTNDFTLSDSESLRSTNTVTPAIGLEQESARLLSSLPSSIHPEFSFPEHLSISSTTVQPLFPEDNNLPSIQTFHYTPSETTLFRSTSIEGSNYLSSNASANVARTSISLESPALPASPFSFSDFDLGLNEDLNAADQSSSSGTHRTGPPKRRKSPGGPSPKHTEPLPCPTCPKTFLRRCELSKHLKTHNRAFKCDVPGCKSQGFYRMQDLNRHTSSCHGACKEGSRSFCEYGDCEYASKGFPRNDNCLRHMRLKHGYPNGLESVA